MTCSPVLAEIIQFEDDGIRYDLDTDTHTACCTWFLGRSVNNPDIVLDDAVTFNGETYPITSIGYHACINNGLLQSLKLGQYVTEIAEEAVMGSSKLATVELNSALKVIGPSAFSNCSVLQSIDIPEGVTTIGDFAFMGSGLRQFTIPASVQTIGINPFRSCTGITTIGLDAANTNFVVADGALLTKDRTRLICVPAGNGATEYTIPSGVKIIGEHSMRNNPTLTKIIIPEGVETVGEFSMGVISHLTEVSIPASVTQIGPGVFYRCGALTDLNIASGNTNYKTQDGLLLTADGKVLLFSPTREGEYTIPDGIEVIDQQVFSGMSFLTKVTCPNSVKRMERGAFTTSGIQNIVFGEGLEYIGFGCFQSCASLKEVVLPASCRTLDKQAFTYCSAMTNLVLNEGLQSIYEMAFYGCNGLTEVTIPGTATDLGRTLFYNCAGLKKVIFGEGCTIVPGMCFEYDTALEEVVLPETMEVIGDFSFCYCKGLTNINLPSSIREIQAAAFEFVAMPEVNVPDGVTEIPEYCFASMPYVEKINVPGSVKYIGKVGIHNDPSLRTLILHEGLEELGERAITLNESLKTLTLPASLTTYGEFAINYNTSMTDLYVLAETPAEMEYDLYDPETWAFPGYEVVTLHVPVGCLEAYASAPIWMKFEKIIADVDPAGVADNLAGKIPVRHTYYDMNGNQVPMPKRGSIYVVKTTYDDGTVVVDKTVGNR